MFDARTLLRAFALSLSLILVACAHDPQPKNLGNVLLLGDSITQAAVGNKGYRYPLWKHLVDDGHRFEFIGSVQHNFDAGNTANTSSVTRYPDYAGRRFDTRNEGHWGWKTTDILGMTQPTRTPGTGTGKLEVWLSGYTPDIAVVLLGVNDIRSANGQSVMSTQANMARILDALIADNPKVAIYLISVLPTKADFASPRTIDDLNKAYMDLARNRAAVRYVDVHSRFDPVIHSYDGVHPNAQGEQVVADAIYQAMKK